MCQPPTVLLDNGSMIQTNVDRNGNSDAGDPFIWLENGSMGS